MQPEVGKRGTSLGQWQGAGEAVAVRFQVLGNENYDN